MAIKVYVSGICGSQEVRKQQQRVLFILQSLPIDLQVIDVTEPDKIEDLAFIQNIAKEHNKSTQLPPQIFNDLEYCGSSRKPDRPSEKISEDYADFEVANDDDEIMKFLKIETPPSKSDVYSDPIELKQNGVTNHENKEFSEISDETEAHSKLTPEKDDISEDDPGNNVEASIDAEKVESE